MLHINNIECDHNDEFPGYSLYLSLLAHVTHDYTLLSVYEQIESDGRYSSFVFNGKRIL